MMILLCLWWCLCAAIVLMWFFPLCMRACECVWLRVNHLVSFRFVLSFVCSSLSYLFCSFLLFVVSSLFGLSCLFLSLSLFYCALFFFSFSLLACFVSLSLLFLFFCFSLILRFFVRVFYHWVFFLLFSSSFSLLMCFPFVLIFDHLQSVSGGACCGGWV